MTHTDTGVAHRSAAHRGSQRCVDSMTEGAILPNGYWLAPHAIYGSEYPAGTDAMESARRVSTCLDAGVRCFIDLRELGHELGEYDDLLAVEAQYRGIEVGYHRRPLPDRDVPSSAAMMEDILACIDRALAAGRPVLVHCHAGIGRTGMTLAAWLTTRGWPPQAALALVQQRYWETPLGRCTWLASPQLPLQRAFVAAWAQRSGARPPATPSSHAVLPLVPSHPHTR